MQNAPTAIKKGEEASIPYFLHLDYFAKANEGKGSLLILGTQPTIRKAFVAAGKTAEKVYISYGMAQLDANNILRFVPEKNGMKVKPKPVVEAVKQAPISKSNLGFWSKRKINNIIIGAEQETGEELTGNSELVEGSVTYTQEGVNSEIYDQFKSFVNRDYTNSNGTRNAEYYAQTLSQVDQWMSALQAEFKTKGDKELQAGYQAMGKEMLDFKKQVQEEMQQDKAQHINESSSLSSFKQVFERTYKEYQASEDAYQQSILKGKLERVILELEQKVQGGEDEQAATLLANFKKAVAKLATTQPTIDSTTQQQLEQVVQEMQQLLQQLQGAPVA